MCQRSAKAWDWGFGALVSRGPVWRSRLGTIRFALEPAIPSVALGAFRRVVFRRGRFSFLLFGRARAGSVRLLGSSAIPAVPRPPAAGVWLRLRSSAPLVGELGLSHTWLRLLAYGAGGSPGSGLRGSQSTALSDLPVPAPSSQRRNPL